MTQGVGHGLRRQVSSQLFLFSMFSMDLSIQTSLNQLSISLVLLLQLIWKMFLKNLICKNWKSKKHYYVSSLLTQFYWFFFTEKWWAYFFFFFQWNVTEYDIVLLFMWFGVCRIHLCTYFVIDCRLNNYEIIFFPIHDFLSNFQVKKKPHTNTAKKYLIT